MIRTSLRALALASLLLPSALLAQQDETLARGDGSFGGFGGPMFRVTQAAGETIGLAGGGGSFLIGRRLAIGGAGFGGTSRVDAILEGNPTRGEMDLAYGGLTIEIISRPSKLVHPVFGVLIGAGSVSVWPDDLRPRNRSGTEEMFGVVEPHVGLELNVIKWFRIGANVGYRVAFNAEDSRLADSGFNGASGTLVLRFGAF